MRAAYRKPRRIQRKRRLWHANSERAVTTKQRLKFHTSPAMAANVNCSADVFMFTVNNAFPGISLHSAAESKAAFALVKQLAAKLDHAVPDVEEFLNTRQQL